MIGDLKKEKPVEKEIIGKKREKYSWATESWATKNWAMEGRKQYNKARDDKIYTTYFIHIKYTLLERQYK